jgi:hypothetical protein
MTYYEELGLSPAASADQIRHSYKALARLLHPDQCSDENLKRLAELQMRRLNQILAVLTDPEKRRRYDAHSVTPAIPIRRQPGPIVVPVPEGRPWVRRWMVGLCAWGLPLVALVVSMAILLSYGSGARPATASSAPSERGDRAVATVAASPATAISDAPPAELREAEIDRDRLLARLRASEVQLAALRAEHQRTLTELALTAHPASRPETFSSPVPAMLHSTPENRPAALVTQREPGFAGNWYYIPEERPTPSKGVYLPEYIELHVSESAGVIRGRYQARYQVTNQAIDPDVVFQFEGGGRAPTTQVPWAGPGDSRGKLTLRLISADQLEVSWSATRLGADLNLASGSAQLVRQREP